ncbi:MAG: class I SAM-dependent RNA methyltransferase [Oscillospiraceae bacterium]|nr:class I SAM-dependent RNA methyltransferase [Oscillospiraceae bacterium]
MKYNFVAPCHFGLEKTLSFEVKKIGGEDIVVTDGKVFFSGTASICAKANVFLSTAERVCTVLGKFRAETFDELFEGIKKLPLSEFIGKTDRFPNSGHSLNSKLSSVPACQKIIKKAMAVNLGNAYGMNILPESGNECKIRFSIMKNEVLLMLDTSGDGLHKRGYRRDSNAAPIRETLAAGIVDIARVRDRDLVCDPFCGSGTLLIESALKALNVAPGLNRSFSGEHMKFLPKTVWESAREEARSLIKTESDFRAVGFDVDPECVKLTLANAEKAGVGKFIKAEKRDIREFEKFDPPVKMITNPPYGERLLELSEARELYKIMGEKLLPLGENSLYVITPDEEFESTFGQKADKNRKLYNGMMMCRLYTYYK